VIENSSPRRIEIISDNIEKKQKKIRALKGIVEFFIAAIIILSLCSVLSFISLNHIFLSLTKILTIIAITICFYKFFLSVLLTKHKIAALSDELDKLSPGLGEDFINARLLKLSLGDTENATGISKNLIIAHIDRVVLRLETSDLSALFAAENFSRYWKPVTIVLISFLLVILFTPSEYRNFLFSRNMFYLDKRHLLELADIKITYDYPAYTHMPSKVALRTDGNIEAIKGTNVTFEATALKPVNRGKLILEKGVPHAIDTKKQSVKANFVVVTDDTYYIEDQNNGTRSRNFRIKSLEDFGPEVKIDHPLSKANLAGLNEQLEISYRATDDFGISKIILEWESSKGVGSKTIEQVKTETKSKEGEFLWDLQGIEAEPDETINVKLKVYDNDTVSGPKTGESNVIKVTLSNPNKTHEAVMSIAEKLQEQLLEILADEIDNSRFTDNPLFKNKNLENAASEEETRRNGKDEMLITQNFQQTITSKIKNALSSLDNGLVKMKNDEQSDYTHFIGLSNMKTRIEDLYFDRVQLISSLAPNYFSRLDNQITREINEFEDDILFLDSMLKGEKLRQSLNIGAKMEDEYDNLKGLLEQFNQNNNEKTRREIEKKIEYLKNQLSLLAQKLSELSGDLQREFLNHDAFPSIDLDEKLNSILKEALNGEMGDALKLLEDFRNSMQDMIASLESGLKSYRTASLSTEMMKLNDFISRLNNIEKEEKALKLITQDHKETLLDSTKNGNLRDFVDNEREKIEMLENYLLEMKSKSSPVLPDHGIFQNHQLFDRILDQTDELSKWLEAFEFREALTLSKEVEERINGISDLSKLGYGGMENLSKQRYKSELLAKEIHNDLENLLKSEKKESNTQYLAQTQNEIREESTRFASELRNSQNEPSLPPAIGDSLEEARDFMGGALKNLKENELSRAISNQEEAIKSLKKARSQSEDLLKDFMLSSNGAGKSVPLVLGKNQSQGSSLGVDTSNVEIPKPQDSNAQQYFKEKILDATKEGSPEGYSDLNKRYYERIIK
jgi:Domain of unknown function (DUF4175)